MLKALEILKNIKYDYSICDHNMVLDNDFTNILVDEAIDELEALNNRSCENCKFFHQSYLCLHLGVGNIQPLRLGFSCCNKWETK